MQIVPALIMMTVTVGVVAAFLIPASYERDAPVLNFYWVGAWLFLALIAAVSGGAQVVMLMGIDGTAIAIRLQTALLVCFPLFIVFAWARLVGTTVVRGARRLAR